MGQSLSGFVTDLNVDAVLNHLAGAPPINPA
jgi:hypothetical protein